MADPMWWTAFGSIATAIGSLATGIGVIAAAIGLRYAGRQLQQSQQIAEDARRVAEASRKIAQGEFLLRLEELFQMHLETHKRLRPGGEWAEGRGGPKTNAEWIDTERYMGLFERINALVRDRIVPLDYIDRFYGYRLLNIVANPVIRQAKLVEQADSWQDFIELWKLIEAHRRKGMEPAATLRTSAPSPTPP